MKQTQNKQTGLVLGLSAIMMLAMVSVSVQNVYADSDRPMSAFAKLSIFGVQGNDVGFKPFSLGASLLEFLGDEDEDINVTYAGGDDLIEKQDLLAIPASAIEDDVYHPCEAGIFWFWMPQSCIKDTIRTTELPCESFGRIC